MDDEGGTMMTSDHWPTYGGYYKNQFDHASVWTGVIRSGISMYQVTQFGMPAPKGVNWRNLGVCNKSRRRTFNIENPAQS